jgi:hypothetical protein
MRAVLRAVALGMSGAPALAAIQQETATVELFESACTKGDISFEAREAAISSDPAWKPMDVMDIDVAKFSIVKSNSINFDYRNPIVQKQWSREFEGRTVRVVLARFDPKRRYPSLCAIVVPDVENALPYWDAFREASKAIGLKGKSVDLVHYVEYSGQPTGTPMRTDMFSRSQVLGGRKDMHMTLGFQP